MAKQTINIGSVPNDGTGSTLREGGDLINDNFNEIYTAIGDGTTLTSGTFLTTTNSETVQNKTISGSNNTLSNIGNSSLTNSTISIGGITLNLGDTDATPALDLSDATNYPTSSLTGTITNAQLAGSIVNAKLSNSSITIRDDSSTEDAVNLGETLIVTGAGGLVTSVSGNTLTLTQASASLTYSKGTATGDGSTTAFTINSGRAEDDILVFVNGICLVPTDDYTISGTTLTFNTAPAVSAEITFRYLPI